MAVEILPMPAMSVDYEGVSSSGGLIVTPIQSRPEASTTGLAQLLQWWLKVTVIRVA
jgi:hypothetical protein